MPNMFEDLIPQRPGGMFADLVPKAPEPQKQTTLEAGMESVGKAAKAFPGSVKQAGADFCVGIASRFRDYISLARLLGRPLPGKRIQPRSHRGERRRPNPEIVARLRIG